MAGCLVPLVLLIVGGGIGEVVGGHAGAYYGGAIGLLVGAVAMVVLIWMLSLAKRR